MLVYGVVVVTCFTPWQSVSEGWGEVKFHIANFYIKKCPSFLFPLDVLNILYCHQSVPCVVVTYVMLLGKWVDLR